MTEKRAKYGVDEAVKDLRYQPDQREMALVDEMAALNWFASMGTMKNTQLLEAYWDVLNQVAISGHELSALGRKTRNRAALEMLRRTDNSRLSAMALPPSVYETWCRIMRQEKPRNWEVDCGNACAVVEPYGWVPEAGCPVHDADLGLDLHCNRPGEFIGCAGCVQQASCQMAADLEDNAGPFTNLDDKDAGLDDSSGIAISGDMCARKGDACDWCSLVQCDANPDHREWEGHGPGVQKANDILAETKQRAWGTERFGIDIERAQKVIDELRTMTRQAHEQRTIIERSDPAILCHDCAVAESCKFKVLWRTKCNEYVPKSRAGQELARARAKGGGDSILRPLVGDFGIKAERVRERIAELREAEPAEHRCGIVLLLGKLAAVADAYNGLLPLDSTQGQNAAQLAHLAIRASAEIEKDSNCLGLDCDRCGHWAPGE